MSANRSRVLMRQVVIAAGLLFVAAGVSYSGDAPPDDWKAPAQAAKKQNPVPADADAITVGKKVFAGSCLACHGVTGKGDGPAAKDLNPKPRNLSDPAIQGQTDGSMFWKITEGKKPMPAFEKLLSEKERWSVVIYVRTLAAKPAK